MVTNLQMLAYFLNLLSIKHYLVQFWAKFWNSTANIKWMGVLQILDSPEMKANFNIILPYFSLNIPSRSLYYNFNC